MTKGLLYQKSDSNCCIATHNGTCTFTNIHLHAETSLTGNDDFNERTNTLLYRNINLSHFILERIDVSVVCVRDVLETGTDCYIDPSSSGHSSTSPSFRLGLLNRGSLRAQSPLSAAGSQFGILCPTDSNRLCTWLYYCLTFTCFRCSAANLHRCIS